MAPTDSAGVVAQAVYGLRLIFGYTQEEAARRCGMDHSYLSRLESGQRRMTRDGLTKLVAGFKLDQKQADALYLLAGFLPPDLVVPHAYDTEMIAMWRAMRRRNPTAAALEESERKLDDEHERQERQKRQADDRDHDGQEERDPDEGDRG